MGGRYYGMDRDHRWERTAAAYDAIVHGVGLHAATAEGAIADAYARGETDEFVRPTVIDGPGPARGENLVRDGDALIHCNFRADRARQLTHALADPTFDGFDRSANGPVPKDLLVVTMTAYEAGLPVEVAFPPEVAHSLAEELSKHGWRQLHVAETEKYAHVTYFFNGGVEEAWPGEERILVPSQKVATYDLAPEMSAAGVTDAIVAGIESDGSTSSSPTTPTPTWSATPASGTPPCGRSRRSTAAWPGSLGAIEALEARDPGARGAALLITADHGNADQMRDADGRPMTAHSLNPVPIVLVGRSAAGRSLHDGVLADVAPTILELAGLPRWAGMTGTSLLDPRAG